MTDTKKYEIGFLVFIMGAMLIVGLSYYLFIEGIKMYKEAGKQTSVTTTTS